MRQILDLYLIAGLVTFAASTTAATSTTPITTEAASPASGDPELDSSLPQPGPQPGTQPAPIAKPRQASRDYQLGPHDRIRLVVIGFEEFNTIVEISNERTVLLPILGELQLPTPLSLGECEGLIAASIADGYVRDPKVRVTIDGFRSTQVWVFGAVAQPGEHKLAGPTAVMRLLSLAGDLESDAGNTMLIERRINEQTTDEQGTPVKFANTVSIQVDLKALLHDGDLDQNIDLQDGDKVYVPRSTKLVYAFGEVGKPGYYPFREGLRVAELISMAGGFTEFANRKKVKIRRENEKKARQVNLKDFFNKGDLEANVALNNGDIVVVNSSFFF